MGISKSNLGISIESILNFITGKIPSSHNVIAGRDTNDAHPLSAITGLQDKVNLIDDINIAQKTVNMKFTQCLSSVTDGQDFTPVVGLIIPFIPITNNGIEYNQSTKMYKLKANTSYNIEALVRLISYQGYMYYCLYDYTNSKVIGKAGVHEANDNINQAMVQSFCIIKPTTDINVGIRITTIGGTQTGAKLQNTSYMNIQEIERTIIDPVEYVNTDKGIEDTPVGNILSFMGTTPPAHYVTCNGAIYNIVDYPYLSQHIKDQFGTFNFFGGDGTTTFAVPDLRNEFLRGYYGDKTEKLSGGIGVHQDSTSIPYFATRVAPSGAGLLWYARSKLSVNNDTVPKNTETLNYDTKTPLHEPAYNGTNVNATSGWGMTSAVSSFTTKPTNVAVLYCIKYEPTYFMAIQGLLEETVLWEGALSINCKAGTVTAPYHFDERINLTNSLFNYDKIEIVYSWVKSDTGLLSFFERKQYDTKNLNVNSDNFQINIKLGYNYTFATIAKILSNTQLMFETAFADNPSLTGGTGIQIHKVIGIKYKTFQN